jgi:hypothetical protein
MILSMNTPINPAQDYAFAGPGPIRLKPAGRGGVRRVAGAFGRVIFPAALLIIAIGCFSFLDQKRGSGNVIAQERAIDQDFNGVNLVGSPTVRVTVDESAEPKVVVTTDDNLQENVTTEIRDGVLVIDIEGNISTTKGIRVDVTVPSLASATLTGSGDIIAEGIEADDFTAKLTGSGDIELRGTCSSASLSLTGSGDILSESLEAQTVKASVSGSGDVSLTAREAVEAKVTGSGDINISGEPAKVSRSVTGSGGVNVK